MFLNTHLMFVYQQTVESEATAENLYVKTRQHNLFLHESRTRGPVPLRWTGRFKRRRVATAGDARLPVSPPLVRQQSS